MGIVRLETKEQLENKCRELFDELNTREQKLCEILGMEYLSVGFYTDILPKIQELADMEDNFYGD